MTTALYTGIDTHTCPAAAGTGTTERTTPSVDENITTKMLRDFVRRKLATDGRWATHWLMEIYRRQTTLEQATGSTAEANGMGFGQFDSKILSSFAQQRMERGFLSPRQMEMLHGKIPRYWRQVVELMGREEVAVCLTAEMRQEQAAARADVAVRSAKVAYRFDGDLVEEFPAEDETAQESTDRKG